eukprot:SAG31_NODE_2885_length_4953_cov_4.633498_6_plen_162_part_00
MTQPFEPDCVFVPISVHASVSLSDAARTTVTPMDPLSAVPAAIVPGVLGTKLENRLKAAHRQQQLRVPGGAIEAANLAATAFRAFFAELIAPHIVAATSANHQQNISPRADGVEMGAVLAAEAMKQGNSEAAHFMYDVAHVTTVCVNGFSRKCHKVELMLD